MPKCQSDNTQRLQVVYGGGAQNISTSISSVIVVVWAAAWAAVQSHRAPARADRDIAAGARNDSGNAAE